MSYVEVNGRLVTVDGKTIKVQGGSADLNAIEVYVADFNAADDLTVTTGAVDRYARVVVS